MLAASDDYIFANAPRMGEFLHKKFTTFPQRGEVKIYTFGDNLRRVELPPPLNYSDFEAEIPQ